MSELTPELLLEKLHHFDFPEPTMPITRYGNGHINDTFLVTTPQKRGILQRINNRVFPHPDLLMENIQRVTRHLAASISARGGDPLRETLTLIPTRDGKFYIIDDAGDCWRLYLFVEHTMSYDLPENETIFMRSGKSFGMFQRSLSDFDASVLHEVIPHFHDTPVRFRNFTESLKQDKSGRAKEVQQEIEFVLAREKDMNGLTNLLRNNPALLRVTHNDTKLNNILMDQDTGEGICVIDLDTVMPGMMAYDFGDSIRFGANTALEDEPDLTKVSLSMPMYTAYTKGFLEGLGGGVSVEEKKTLPLGAKLMTLECGMRFLTDYLDGDVYFRTHRPHHNLDRARNQFALVKSMEEQWEAMEQVVMDTALAE